MKFGYCHPNSSTSIENTAGALVVGDTILRDSLNPQYTPLLRNIMEPAYREHYYIEVSNIYVNDLRVEIPPETFQIGSEEDGGSIIDSGTNFTWLLPAAFDPLVSRYNQILLTQLINPPHANFPVCSYSENVGIPSLTFEFKGGARWTVLSTMWGWVKFVWMDLVPIVYS